MNITVYVAAYEAIEYIYKRGPACGFPDQGKYVFFPRFCVFVNIGSNVHFLVV